jgi:hypothetical protein
MVEISYIDIVPITSKVVEKEALQFQRLVSIANSIDQQHAQELLVSQRPQRQVQQRQQQQAQQQAQPQPQKAQQVQPISSQTQQVSQSPQQSSQVVVQPSGASTEKMQQRIWQLAQRQEVAASKGASQVAGEVNVFIKNLKKRMVQKKSTAPSTTTKGEQHEEVNVFRVNLKGKDEGVLSRLSLQDQISELEKIIQGLNENVFSAEQLTILKQEASGLEAEIGKLKKSGVYEKRYNSDEQFAVLVMLRDKRLQEAIEMLGETNGSV